eukprot:TRINITY_DN488_c0_g1_i2.p1 TRINITY_DN488_c0_g1~~TRINITY_DN488_c0_g1_i2.p1  ORF type:complete len:286 (+),score=64.71 TRINITY_DN488_c0_g1_i2:85-942(+)
MSVSAWKALGRACGLSRNTAAASAAAAVRGKYGRPGKAEFVYFPKEFLFEDPKMPLLEDPESGWTIHSRRCGVIAKKLGMMPVWNKYMEHFPVTVLEIQDCQVTQVKTREKEGFYAIQVGAGERTLKHTTKPMLRHFEKAGVEPKMVTGEFRVTPDALLPVGTTFNAKHFVPGQLLDVQGVTSGKGFQGGMKRWGFGGLFATHGVSKAHRSIGSTGQCQDPGKVWKGKKMPGRMGGKKRTQKNLFVHTLHFLSSGVFLFSFAVINFMWFIRCPRKAACYFIHCPR